MKAIGRSPILFHSLCLLISAVFAASAVKADEGSPEADIQRIIARLESGDDADRKEARATLQNLAGRAGKNDKTRRPVSLALIEIAGNTTLSDVTRVSALQVLPRVGRYEAVRPVAGMLKSENPKLRDAARQSLEALPVPTATKPLRDALKTATGEFRVALVQSVGKRQDSLSVGLLLPMATSEERALRLAALAALAEIGDRSAKDVIDAAVANVTADDRDAVLASFTRFAWRLRETSEGGASRRAFLKLAELEGKWCVAGIEGLGKTGVRREVPLLLSFLDSEDETIRNAARQALGVLRGSAQDIAAIVDTADTPLARRAELLDVLALRKDASRVADSIVKASHHHAPEVRGSAAGALARLDVDTAGARLMALLADADASVKKRTSKVLVMWKADGAHAFLEKQRDATPDAGLRASLEAILEARKA